MKAASKEPILLDLYDLAVTLGIPFGAALSEGVLWGIFVALIEILLMLRRLSYRVSPPRLRGEPWLRS